MKSELTDVSIGTEKLNNIFRGVVEDCNDPHKAGRVRIRIFGLHSNSKNQTTLDGIPTVDLPWAEPANPVFGGISKTGIFGVPNNGAHVFLFFENGDITQPRYFATALGIPLSGKKQRSGVGGGDPNEENPKDVHVFQPDNDIGTDFTDPTKVFVVKGHCGHSIVLDSTEGNEKITIKNGKTGAYIALDQAGNVEIHSTTSASASNNESSGNKSVTVAGNYVVNVIPDPNNTDNTGNNHMSSSNYSENVTKNKDVLVGGSLSESIEGTMDIKAKDANISTSGEMVVASSGKNTFAAGKDCVVKSSDEKVILSSLLKNIEMKALIGTVKSNSMMLDLKATLTADFGGLMTTVGGTTSCVTTISGQVIMIG